MMSRVGKTEGAGALHRGILEARLEKRAILPNFNVDIRDQKFLIGLRLTESNLRFRNFGFEMGFCPISPFPPAGYSSMLLPSARRGYGSLTTLSAAKCFCRFEHRLFVGNSRVFERW